MVHSPFCIYGAGIVATSIYTALKMHYMRIPECFLVSSREGNPSEIDGLLVKTIDEYSVKAATGRFTGTDYFCRKSSGESVIRELLQGSS